MDELLAQFDEAEKIGDFHAMDDVMDKVLKVCNQLKNRRDFVYSNGTEKQLSEPHENE
jgi:hypothetical protein